VTSGDSRVTSASPSRPRSGVTRPAGRLRKVEDKLFDSTCVFLDQDKRGCSIYHARPNVCREYPDRPRCVYYDVLQFERKQQGDDTVLPLFQITFREVEEEKEEDGEEGEMVWEWQPEKRSRKRKAGR
jgi:uncharacterized protein